MTKNNNLIPIEKQKLVEEVRELTETAGGQEYQSQTNKSNLSSAARNKVISKSGSEFVDEYYRILPYGPSVGGVNPRNFEANTNGAYENSDSYIVGSCLGRIYVKDERPAYETFKASFGGSPEIKLLILDLYKMRSIEGSIENSPAEFENLKRTIERNSGYYGGLIDWENF